MFYALRGWITILFEKIGIIRNSLYHTVLSRLLTLYYKSAWAMPLYYQVFPPTKKTWCALLEFKGVIMPAQNIWQATLPKLESFIARSTDVFFVTYPKSGTHMLAPLLMELLWSSSPDCAERLRYSKSDAAGHYPMFLEFGHPIYKNKDQLQPWSPRFFQTHLPLSLFPSDILKKGCRIVYLVRDPRACTVSALHFCRSKKRKLFNPSIEELVDSEWDSKVQIYTGWHSHVSEWVRFSEHYNKICVVSYEEMVENSVMKLVNIAAFLEVTTTKSEIVNIISRNSLSKARSEAAPMNRKYFRRGSPSVSSEWCSLIPEAKRTEIEALMAARWKGSRMDQLLRVAPCLRRYAPSQEKGRPEAPAAGRLRRIGIIGLGAHNKRVYFPYLERNGVSLALVVDVEGQRAAVEGFLCARALRPERVVLVPDAGRAEGALPACAAEALAAARLDGLIVSCEALAHQPYLRWALEYGVDVLVDKPPIVPAGYPLLQGRDGLIAREFDQVLALAARSRSNAVVMVQRRAHPGYLFAHSLLSDTVRRWGVPLSHLDISHADGMWCTPGELATREQHPYKHGYGKLMHSGYHFVDLLAWFADINAAEAPAKARPAAVEAVCWPFRAADALHQLRPADLCALLGATPEEAAASFGAVADASRLGELNVHALVRFCAAAAGDSGGGGSSGRDEADSGGGGGGGGGATVCTASLNLLQNSFSRRGWFHARPDGYKGNGRVRHERLVAHVGPLLSVHVHSYQAAEAGAVDDPPPPAGSPDTRARLRRCGLDPDAAASPGGARGDAAGAGFRAGDEDHFEVTVYRNVAVIGGPAVETIPVGALLRAVGGHAAGYLGQNETARHRILDDWLARRRPPTDAPRSPKATGVGAGEWEEAVRGVGLAEQRGTMVLLSRLCEAMPPPPQDTVAGPAAAAAASSPCSCAATTAATAAEGVLAAGEDAGGQLLAKVAASRAGCGGCLAAGLRP